MNNNNNNNNNLTRNSMRDLDIEKGKAGEQYNQNPTTTTATTTKYQQPRRRYPEHSTIGKLTTSSTAYQWNSNLDNSNNNRKYNNNKTLPVSSSWVNDPEIKRQRRIMKYKAYAVEGQMKSSLRSGLRWVKNKYCQLVHGY